ncbi:SAG family member [Eimeria necatrix]|uniref:SAG family member n=1 Tax=Eimeria necatrix TaxID=51315 RepID=U6MKL0_9EIME|nr:SAG family member [Eimeria necatrix]CDJ62190.1 SAG family member [Eimeria necatrix]
MRASEWRYASSSHSSVDLELCMYRLLHIKVQLVAGCLTIINTLRTENVRGLLKTLTEAGNSKVTESLKKIQLGGLDSPTAQTIAAELEGTKAASCNLGESASAKKYPGLVIPFAHDADFDCAALIQETYTAGLSPLKQSNFDPSSGTYDNTQAPFDNVAASNVAFILSAKSTKVSCAATKDCEAGHDVLFCYFIEPLQAGDKPFTAELYNALWGLETGAASISAPSVVTALSPAAVIILVHI